MPERLENANNGIKLTLTNSSNGLKLELEQSSIEMARLKAEL